jgi:hypothetical protein
MVSLSEIVLAHVEASWKFLGPTSKRERCFTYAARVKSLIQDGGIRFEVVATVRIHIVAFLVLTAFSVRTFWINRLPTL